MTYKMIHSPSAGTLEMLFRRSGQKQPPPVCKAVGLIQGRLIDMIYAADLAEKAAGVTVEDIRGSCPQNMIMIAIYGDSAAVEEAIKEIRRKVKEQKSGGEI